MPLFFFFWLSCLTAAAIDAVENPPKLPQIPESVEKGGPKVPDPNVHPPQKPETPPPLIPVTFKPIEPTTFHVTQKPELPQTTVVPEKPFTTVKPSVTQVPEKPSTTKIPTTKKPSVTQAPEKPLTTKIPTTKKPSVTQKPKKPPTQIPLTVNPSITKSPAPTKIPTTIKPDDVKFEDQCVCEAHGDPHYKTYDNTTFSMLYDCSFIMSQAVSQDGVCNFRVEVENERHLKSAYKRRAYINVVKIFIGGMRLTIGQGQTVQVNGDLITLPYDKDPFYIRLVGDFVTVTSACGIKVEFDGDNSARVTVPKMLFYGQLSGLCGNCDGKSETDWLPGTLKLRQLARIKALAKKYGVKEINRDRERCHAFS